MIWVIAIFFLIVLGIWGMAALTSAAAQAETARAAVEAARAAQIASTGQAFSTFFLGMIATLLVVALLGMIGLVVWMRVQHMRQPKAQPVRAIPAHDRHAMPRMDPTQILLMMMAKQMLDHSPNETRQLPAAGGAGEPLLIETAPEEESPAWWQ